MLCPWLLMNKLLLAAHEFNTQYQMPQADIITIAQDTGLMRDQTLTIEVGAIMAARIHDIERTIAPNDGGMTARNAFFRATEFL